MCGWREKKCGREEEILEKTTKRCELPVCFEFLYSESILNWRGIINLTDYSWSNARASVSRYSFFLFLFFFFYWLEQLFLQESTVKELLKQRGKRNNNKRKIYRTQGVAEMRGWEINGRGRIWQPTVCNQRQVLQNLEDVCFMRQWSPAPGLCLVIYGSWQLLQRLN